MLLFEQIDLTMARDHATRMAIDGALRTIDGQKRSIDTYRGLDASW